MIKIIADSTCDLSKDLLERYHTDILPLHILLGDAEYEDGRNLTPEQIYAWADEHKTTPKTSAPSVDTALEVFAQGLKEADEIISFSISESMSTSANIMRLAAKELNAEDRIHVVNAASLSTGTGLLVLRAADMAEQGSSCKEILAEIERLKPMVRASFVVDTLTYLYRGGRCNGLEAMVGSVLRLHPKIVVKNGSMGSAKKYRGRMEHVILNYVTDMEPELMAARKERVFITHSGCSRETVEQVRAYLEGLHHFDEILETRAGGVISSHCGPGTLGVLFIASQTEMI